MKLSALDWAIVLVFLLITLGIGLIVSQQSGKNSKNYFLSGRNMPWWLLGISMVATTFAADTPTLVTQIVREQGVSGNWVWWAFLLTGMLTVFVYSKLWRRSEVLTDLEFYELRYGGKYAAFLRGFRAVYLGIIFNVIIMATVLLAGIKLGHILLGLQPWQTVLVCGTITVIYSAIGGLKGVLITDFFQFLVAMIGSIWACYLVLSTPQIGGLEALWQHEAVRTKLSFLPDFSDPNLYWPIFLMPLLVQWWSVWYPGAEPGGGGYVAQRILAAKDEKNALWATLFFNITHYAIRPWPWILIGLASLIIYPNLSDIQSKFPNISPDLIKDDMAYPAMLYLLPPGVIGLVTASLMAALMSTISTHLNWGASYITKDLYKRFIHPSASEKQQVNFGRFTTILFMIISSIVALFFLSNARQGFQLILQIGAGTGLLFIMRWFWWRINAWSEISAMASSFLIAVFIDEIWPKISTKELNFSIKIISGVLTTTLIWVAVTLLTKPEKPYILSKFYYKIKPHNLGWVNFLGQYKLPLIPSGSIFHEILGMIIACIGVYAILFGTGLLLYGQYRYGTLLFMIATISFIAIKRWILPRIKLY